jgi:hypothetical protein
LCIHYEMDNSLQQLLIQENISQKLNEFIIFNSELWPTLQTMESLKPVYSTYNECDLFNSEDTILSIINFMILVNRIASLNNNYDHWLRFISVNYLSQFYGDYAILQQLIALLDHVDVQKVLQFLKLNNYSGREDFICSNIDATLFSMDAIIQENDGFDIVPSGSNALTMIGIFLGTIFRTDFVFAYYFADESGFKHIERLLLQIIAAVYTCVELDRVRKWVDSTYLLVRQLSGFSHAYDEKFIASLQILPRLLQLITLDFKYLMSLTSESTELLLVYV